MKPIQQTKKNYVTIRATKKQKNQIKTKQQQLLISPSIQSIGVSIYHYCIVRRHRVYVHQEAQGVRCSSSCLSSSWRKRGQVRSGGGGGSSLPYHRGNVTHLSVRLLVAVVITRRGRWHPRATTTRRPSPSSSSC